MEKFVVVEDVYYISIDDVQSNDGFFECSNTMPYIKAGEIVIKRDGCFEAEGGETVPVERCKVKKLREM